MIIFLVPSVARDYDCMKGYVSLGLGPSLVLALESNTLSYKLERSLLLELRSKVKSGLHFLTTITKSVARLSDLCSESV